MSHFDLDFKRRKSENYSRMAAAPNPVPFHPPAGLNPWPDRVALSDQVSLSSPLAPAAFASDDDPAFPVDSSLAAASPAPPIPAPDPGPTLNWLFVDLNSYFASVEQEVRPELRRCPVAVVPMMADTTVCIAASYEAKAFGIRTGTVVAEARRMCPDLILVEARHEIYVDYHHRIVEAVESCLPVTGKLATVTRKPSPRRR